ncbi:MAG: AMP-binding protein [Actinobacteria bacterium]|nr:AMP-binding protein [Actinomycetota bacterium]
MQRLIGAGALTVKSPALLLSSLPWLIGRGPSLGILSQMNGLSLGKKPAIVDRNGAISFRDLDKEANRIARALHDAGVGPGGKVAMLLRNGREMAAIVLGAQKSGIVACPLNTWAKTKELTAVAENLKADLLVYDTAHTVQAACAARSGTKLVHVGGGEALDGSITLERFQSGKSSLPPLPIARDKGSAQIIIQTSGTTGTPKGAARDASAAGIGVLANLLGSVPYRRDDVVLCSSPLFHSFGLATFTFATVLGATVVMPERFDPEDCLRMIEEHQVTTASLVPVMIRRIVSLPDATKEKYDLSSLRILMASGSSLSLDLKKAATELFGEVLYDLYGSTEIGWVAIATPQTIKDRPKSVGKPVEGIEVAVFDKAGTKLPPNETGELYVKSGVLFTGYTSGETKDQREGLMSIGDLGRLDDEGYLYVDARSDDMAVIGGENVYPVEVEEVIESMAGVTEVTVLPVPDEEFGQVLAAFVVGTPSEAAIREHCAAELASYKVPRTVKILDELPRTSTGKVLKREINTRSP